MHRYARTWAALTAAPALVGGFLCLAMVPITAWIPLAVVVAAATLWVHHLAGPWAEHKQLVLPGVTATTAATVLGVLATWGWGSLTPVLAAVFVLAVGLSALPILAAVAHQHRSPGPGPRRRPGSPTRPHPTVAHPGRHAISTVDAALTAVDVRARLAPRIERCDDTELCRCWRASYTRLQRAAVEIKPAIVLERQLYLDELLRRHPTGATRWLRTARAASDPTRHLHDHDEPRAELDIPHVHQPGDDDGR